MDVDAPSEETTGEISVAPLAPPPPPAPITVTNKQESAPVWSYPGEIVYLILRHYFFFLFFNFYCFYKHNADLLT